MGPLSSKPRAMRALGVVDEVELACNRRNRLATALGVVLGGVIPVATYVEAHVALDATVPLFAQPAAYLVAGGLLFSAKTVFAWGRRAFRDSWKALGFVVLLEGVMITSNVPVLPLVLLGILVAINGIATGCILSLDRSSVRAAPEATRRARAAAASRERSSTSSALVQVEPPTLVIASRSTRGTRRSAAAQNRFAFAEPS